MVAHEILLSAPVPIGPLFLFFFVLGLELDLWGLGLGLGLDNLTQSTVIEVKYGFHFSVIGNTTTNSINWLLDRLIQMD